MPLGRYSSLSEHKGAHEPVTSSIFTWLFSDCNSGLLVKYEICSAATNTRPRLFEIFIASIFYWAATSKSSNPPLLSPHCTERPDLRLCPLTSTKLPIMTPNQANANKLHNQAASLIKFSSVFPTQRKHAFFMVLQGSGPSAGL